MGSLTAQGTQTWSGTGSVLFGGSDTMSLTVSSGATLTLGAGLTLHGQSGEISGTFINQGTIAADLAGRPAGSTAAGTLILTGTGWSNQGTLEVDANETLAMAGSGWTNSGSHPRQRRHAGLRRYPCRRRPVHDDRPGHLPPSPAGNFSRTGGTVNLTGTLDNTGGTLALDGRTGGWNVAGGTVIGGSITTSGGNVLTAVNSSNTLSGVTLDGTLDMGSSFAPKMTVTSGLTLNGTILLGGADGTDVGSLTAQGTQAWSGTGSVLFGGSDTTSLAVSDGATLTLGAGLTLHGQSGEISGTFINQGTIAADLAGRPAGSTAAGTLILTGTGWSNQGTLEVDANETLAMAGSGWTNSGSIRVDGGTLDFGDIHAGAGPFTTTSLGIFAVTGGQFQPHRRHGEPDGHPGQYRWHPGAGRPHRRVERGRWDRHRRLDHHQRRQCPDSRQQQQHPQRRDA